MARGEGIRKRWIFLSFLLGAGVIAFGIVTEARWGWTGIWPSVFLEVGAGIALAGFLFLLERLFVRKTVQLATAAAERRVDERVQPLEEEVAQQRMRIDELGRRSDQVAAERDLEVDAMIAAVSDDVTFHTVRAMLDTGNDSRGLHPLYRVRCGQAILGSLRLELDAVFSESPYGKTEPTMLAHLIDLDGHRIPGPVEWHSGLDAPRFTDSIKNQLELANQPRGLFDPVVAFRNLVDGVDLAVRSRRGDGPRMAGRLIERMTTDIVLTDAGIESLSTGVVAGVAEFPDHAYSKASGKPQDPEFQAPAAPSGVSEEDWVAIVDVAKKTFPLPPTSRLVARAAGY